MAYTFVQCRLLNFDFLVQESQLIITSYQLCTKYISLTYHLIKMILKSIKKMVKRSKTSDNNHFLYEEIPPTWSRNEPIRP